MIEINSILTRVIRESEWGSCQQDYLLLYTLVQVFQVNKVIEIGTHCGASSIAMCQGILDNNKFPSILTIDNWILGDKSEEAKRNFEECGFQEYIILNVEDSKIALSDITQKADMIFIDGDHSFLGVKQDFINSEKLTDIIIFHDTSANRLNYYDWGGRRVKDIIGDDWDIMLFPTTSSEGDKSTVGMTLAKRRIG